MGKTYKRAATYTHTVTSDEATANQAGMDIASGSAPTDEFNFVGQVRRADVDISGFEFEYASGTGMMAVKDAGSANLTADDIITVMGSWTK